MMGDRLDTNNVFKWEVVIMNLPGSSDYNPMVQLESKVRIKEGRVAADLFI
jgi:hypothetical protein